MKLTDFVRLKKYMMMTMSGADAEVLLAVKKANELLVAERVDWDRVLNRMVSLEVESAPPPVNKYETEAERIDAAFQTVEASDPRGSFANFIADLHRQWDERCSLSDKQKSVLFDAAAKVRS